MPIVHIHLGHRPPEMIAKMGRDATLAIAKALEVDPGTVRVLIHEMPLENWLVGGESLPDRYKRKAAEKAKAEGK